MKTYLILALCVLFTLLTGCRGGEVFSPDTLLVS